VKGFLEFSKSKRGVELCKSESFQTEIIFELAVAPEQHPFVTMLKHFQVNFNNLGEVLVFDTHDKPCSGWRVCLDEVAKVFDLDLRRLKSVAGTASITLGEHPCCFFP
jgi:hypothetical protein